MLVHQRAAAKAVWIDVSCDGADDSARRHRNLRASSGSLRACYCGQRVEPLEVRGNADCGSASEQPQGVSSPDADAAPVAFGHRHGLANEGNA
jgi:hypothetical protein